VRGTERRKMDVTSNLGPVSSKSPDLTEFTITISLSLSHKNSNQKPSLKQAHSLHYSPTVPHKKKELFYPNQPAEVENTDQKLNKTLIHIQNP
jgi:hypothetical protein